MNQENTNFNNGFGNQQQINNNVQSNSQPVNNEFTGQTNQNVYNQTPQTIQSQSIQSNVVQQPYMQPTQNQVIQQQGQSQINKNLLQNNKTKKKKFVLFSLITVLALVLMISAAIFLNSNKNYSRTIMIYMVGSNLESENGLATVDLNEIDYNQMDNENVNVLLIAGGSKKWNNDYIDVTETSIYELKSSGFEKVKSQEKSNMGSSEVLSSFLSYVYNNYKTDKYTLMFWDHGAAIYGSEFDELNDEDNLTVEEWKEAFSNSPFNKKNKLEMIIFSTCLNGTIEVADTFVDYSDYLVASEETTIGYKLEGDLNFINKIETSDSSYDVALKFVDSYKQKIKNYKELYTAYNGSESYLYSTYSIVDLSKIKELEESINEFFASIDLSKNYNAIAKVRSNLYQYAYTQSNESSYDMVDLYNLIDGIKDLSPSKAKKVLNNINDTVLYNWATNSESRGLSIYFPYNADDKYKELFLSIYDSFDSLKEYKTFINNFYKIQKTPYTQYSYSKNTVKASSKNDGADFTLELDDNQKETFARANYIVFRDNKDGYYLPVYRGKEVVLNGNTLSASIKDRQLKVISKEDSTEYILTLVETSSTDEYIKYNVGATLEDFTSNEIYEWKMDNVTLSLIYDKKTKTIKIGSAVLDEKDDNKPSTVGVNINDYQYIVFGSSKYRVLDENGNYNENWESNGSFEGYEGTIDETSFELQSFDDDYDYYAVFIIWDTNNNYYYSKLVKMN